MLLITILMFIVITIYVLFFGLNCMVWEHVFFNNRVVMVSSQTKNEVVSGDFWVRGGLF